MTMPQDVDLGFCFSCRVLGEAVSAVCPEAPAVIRRRGLSKKLEAATAAWWMAGRWHAALIPGSEWQVPRAPGQRGVGASDGQCSNQGSHVSNGAMIGRRPRRPRRTRWSGKASPTPSPNAMPKTLVDEAAKRKQGKKVKVERRGAGVAGSTPSLAEAWWGQVGPDLAHRHSAVRPMPPISHLGAAGT